MGSYYAKAAGKSDAIAPPPKTTMRAPWPIRTTCQPRRVSIRRGAGRKIDKLTALGD